MASHTTKNVKRHDSVIRSQAATILHLHAQVEALQAQLAELNLRVLFILNHIPVRRQDSALVGADGKPKVQVTSLLEVYYLQREKFLQRLEDGDGERPSTPVMESRPASAPSSSSPPLAPDPALVR